MSIYLTPSRRVVIIFSIIAILGVAGLIYASNIRYEEIYQNFKDVDIKQLKEQGNRYISRHQPDSALACYMMVTSRYTDNMNPEEKLLVCTSYNNAAYVYSLVYSDYSLAYQFLLKSLKLARDNDFDEIYPYIYLNLGNIYFFYEDYNNAFDNYKKAYALGKKENAEDVVSTTFENVILAAPGVFNENGVKELVRDYKYSYNHNSEMLAFDMAICDMAEQYFNNRPDSAIFRLNDARKSIDKKFLPERYLNNLDYWENLLLQKQGKYNEAMNILKRKADGTTDGDLIGIYKEISQLYDNLSVHDSADSYRIKYINMRDSVLRDQNYSLIRDMQSSFELQNFEQNIKNVELRRRQNERIAIILLINVLILSVFIVMLVRKNRRLNEALVDLYDKNEAETSVGESDADSHRQGDETLPADERQGFQLDEEVCKNLMERIIGIMRQDDVITQCEFTIRKLAELASTRERYISYVLNNYMHKNFNTLLNEYRIEKARHILADADVMRNLTVEGVAMSLGFKSRSNFANIFKKLTGLTPSEYRDIAHGKNKGK